MLIQFIAAGGLFAFWIFDAIQKKKEKENDVIIHVHEHAD